MSQQAITKKYEYIPDSSHAEEWLTADIFVWHGMKFKILLNGEVIKLRRNGTGKKGIFYLANLWLKRIFG